jgi:hypothetical protein
MPRRKMIPGKCRICSKDGMLSFEHVPPEAAFNKSTVIEYTLQSWIIKRKIKGKYRQGGIGEYTLCEKCNRNTGQWYGDEYVKWAKTAFDVLQLIKSHSNQFTEKVEILLKLKNVYPLRYIKQVITCFFSVVGISPDAEFANNNPLLVKFVLDRYEYHLPAEYQLFLRLYDSSILRRFPIAGKINLTYNKNEDGSILHKSLHIRTANALSEITHPPFALIMTYGTDYPDATNITHLSDYQYDEQKDIEIPLLIGYSSTPYPGSYEPL